MGIFKETLPISREREEELLNDLKAVLMEQEHEDTVILENSSYVTAIVGILDDGRLAYDYDEMAEWLVAQDGMSLEEAYEWIDYNTLRALPYAGSMRPEIIYPINGI